MSSRADPPRIRYRYGDFPELFWDAEPDAPVDVTSPVTLERLLTRGRMETVARLVTPDLLLQRLDDLYLPDYVRRFWRTVLEGVPGEAGRPSPARER